MSDKVIRIVLSLAVIVVALGFMGGLVFNDGQPYLCEERKFYCDESFTGEIKANSCTKRDPVFATLLIDVVKFEGLQEFLICENGVEVSTYYEPKDSYSYKALPFFVIQNYFH